MKRKVLSEKSKEKLNELDLSERMAGLGLFYNNALIKYGIPGVAHVYLSDSLRGHKDKKDFAEGYNLQINQGELSVPTEKLKGEFFIPDNAYPNDESIILLNKRYQDQITGAKLNGAMNHRWVDENIYSLWEISEGIEFGKNLWDTCVKEFNIKKANWQSTSKKEGKLVGELMGYYSNLVDYHSQTKIGRIITSVGNAITPR